MLQKPNVPLSQFLDFAEDSVCCTNHVFKNSIDCVSVTKEKVTDTRPWVSCCTITQMCNL